MVRRKHTPAAPLPRTRATAGEQPSAKSEVEEPNQQKRQHTRSSGQNDLLEPRYEPDRILSEARRKQASLPKASTDDDGAELGAAKSSAIEAEGVELEARSPSIVGFGNLSERSPDYSTIYTPGSARAFEEDRLESWYRNVRYFPAIDESAIDALDQVLPPYMMSAVKDAIYKSDGALARGLEDRNVRLDPCESPDPFLAVFHGMEPLESSESNSDSRINLLPLDVPQVLQEHHINEWKLDLQKAVGDQVEAIFQRTAMISMLDRSRLIYNLEDSEGPILDFAVESIWNCTFMPTKTLQQAVPVYAYMLNRPQPDIAVAFHLKSIISNTSYSVLPEAIRRIMVYEGPNPCRIRRVFPFLMVEAKNADKSSYDTKGLIQCLNSASQSLHCLYEFFNEADREEVECGRTCCKPNVSVSTTNVGTQTPSSAGAKSPSADKKSFVDRFYEEVRVFTAVPTSRAITIRVHRACPASGSRKTPPILNKERPEYQLMILPDYPLQFEYNKVISLTEDDYSRERLVNTFKKIMVDYGIGKLRPLLKEAAEVISDKFYKWEEEKRERYMFGMRHYSHGQTSQKKPPAPSDRTRQSAASTTSTWRRRAREDTAGISPGPHHSFSAERGGDLPGLRQKRTRMG